jgi:hypothetical protein
VILRFLLGIGHWKLSSFDWVWSEKQNDPQLDGCGSL